MLRRVADDQFSIDVESPASAQALAAAILATDGWLDVVPGINSVVVQFDAAARAPGDVQHALADILDGVIPEIEPGSELLEIPVLYGGDAGPDLDSVCAELGLSTDEFIALHTKSVYVVDMLGFTPGFAFIGGLDNRLRVARRDTPRERVPAGSIGIADSRSGLYALASPGGWQIVGRTPQTCFDVNARQPSLLQAAMRVRFRAISQQEFDAWR